MACSAFGQSLELVEWNGRTALSLKGAIEGGLAERFASIAPTVPPDAHGVPLLLLDSPGGDVDVAFAVSKIMDIIPFHTVIQSGATCASACASILFVAGTYRTMEDGGLFGLHSCSSGGIQNRLCNEEIAMHAVAHGVSHGAINAAQSYVGPGDIAWYSRADIDGWGISRYPGVEAVGFEKSEPQFFRMLGKNSPAQVVWRLDFWAKGWRAFYRPMADDQRELQLNIFCHESMRGKIFFMLEVNGPADLIQSVTQKAMLTTDVFTSVENSPVVTQIDPMVSGIFLVVPTENVLPLLRSADRFEFRVSMTKPYEDLVVNGSFSGSRPNLKFAANHCDYD